MTFLEVTWRFKNSNILGLVVSLKLQFRYFLLAYFSTCYTYIPIPICALFIFLNLLKYIGTVDPWATRIWATQFWAVRKFGKIKKNLSNAIFTIKSSSYTILRSRSSRKIVLLKTNDSYLRYTSFELRGLSLKPKIV